jgi:hypothetical protein
MYNTNLSCLLAIWKINFLRHRLDILPAPVAPPVDFKVALVDLGCKVARIAICRLAINSRQNSRLVRQCCRQFFRIQVHKSVSRSGVVAYYDLLGCIADNIKVVDKVGGSV